MTNTRPAEIAAWRMSIPYGHRFEATQALRQTLQRAVSWGMLHSNPAKQGVENRQRPRVEQRPFESWEQIRLLSDRSGPRHGPLVADGREHAITLLDAHSRADVHAVDAGWTSKKSSPEAHGPPGQP